MQVKRFVADTMQEAVARVKADFGRDAVILHVRKVRRPGLMFFARAGVEVIAATDGRPSDERRAPARAGQLAPESSGPEGAPAAELAAARAEPAAAVPAIGTRLTAGQGALARVIDELLAQEVREDLAHEIAANVRLRGSAENFRDWEWVKSEVRKELAKGIACSDPWALAQEKRVHCLVGPTGVGKTATIVKLAANYALIAGKQVAVVVAHSRPLAAAEELKRRARTLGMPVDVARTPSELERVVNSRGGFDLVLVDTAGRSPRNEAHMSELRAFVEALEDPLVHLVISATTRSRDMLDIAERFGEVGASRLIVTKLDETASFGAIYNLCRLTGLPLSFVTDGQDVPEDIAVADSERIAAAILGGNADHPA